MKTLVFQSFRTDDVPPALARSMATVRAWAAMRGHDYRFLDDGFFDVLPGWYRERARGNKLVLANLARLLVARSILAEGYQRAVWMDADIAVFDPEGLHVAPAEGFAFTRETWVERRGFDLAAAFKVNNAVCAFDRGNAMLDFAIWAHEALVRDRPERVFRFGTSTTLLTALHVASPLPLLHDVAVLTPAMVRELAERGEGPALRMLARSHAAPLRAANVGYSLVDTPHNAIVASAAHYAAAVDRLVATRGAGLDLAHAQAAPGASSAHSRGTR